MIDRNHIEKILKINGMSPAEPDEMIRSVLLSARYDRDEVDTALMVLREDSETKRIRVEGLHKVFRSNDALDPKEISQLLGINVDATRFAPDPLQPQRVGLATIMAIWLFSIVLAVVGIFLYMHMNNVGVFHPGIH